MVLVDLIVTDRQGRFVADLKPDDVEVYQDNKKKKVLFLELKQTGLYHPQSHQASAPVTSSAPASAGIGATQPGSRASLVIMIDLQSMLPPDLVLAKRSIADFVKSKLAPQDRLMLVILGNSLEVRQPFTGDRERILAALEGVMPQGRQSTNPIDFLQDLEKTVTATATIPGLYLERATSLALSYLTRADENFRSLGTGISTLARDLGSLPGRKSILFFSGGHSPRLAMAYQDIILRRMQELFRRAPREQTIPKLGAMGWVSEFASRLQAAIDVANASQVSFYTIDARGLVGSADASQRYLSSTTYAQAASDSVTNTQDALVSLASTTGGKSFLNSNDLLPGMVESYEDSSRYFELGFAPETDGKAGMLHQIKVEVLRPGLRVRHRQNYFEPRTVTASRRDVENPLKFPGLFQDFPLDVETSYAQGKLSVALLIPTQSLDMRREGGRNRCTLEAFVALLDSHGERVGGNVVRGKSRQLDMGDEGYQELLKLKSLTVLVEIEAEPGAYTLRAMVHQVSSARTATCEKLLQLTGR